MTHKKSKLNHRRRKKMRRKILRRDNNWENVLMELTKYEIDRMRKEQ